MTIQEMLKSNTMRGAIATFFVFLASPEVMGLLPPKVAMVMGAMGTLLTVFGMRTAVERSGPVSEPVALKASSTSTAGSEME